jgi:hypothetical protein
MAWFEKLRVLVGVKQLAETNVNIASFQDNPNEFAKYLLNSRLLTAPFGAAAPPALVFPTFNG